MGLGRAAAIAGILAHFDIAKEHPAPVPLQAPDTILWLAVKENKTSAPPSILPVFSFEGAGFMTGFNCRALATRLPNMLVDVLNFASLLFCQPRFH